MCTPAFQVQQLQAEVDLERKGKEVARQEAERLAHDNEELKTALARLQESLQSADPSAQLQEVVRQVRVAQDGNRLLEAKVSELQQALEESQRDGLAYKQEVRRTRKQLEMAPPTSGGGGNEAMSRQLAETTARLESLTTDLNNARAAAVAGEQKLALAEARAKLAEEFAQEHAESMRKLVLSNNRASARSLNLSVSHGGDGSLGGMASCSIGI